MKLKKTLSVILCLSLVLSAFCGSTVTTRAVTQADINRLKEKQASQAEILNAITARVNELMAVIVENNNKISALNATINANNAEIAQREADIEQDKGEFRKRIRSIYMSNSESQIKVLLGAENFSQFLQLAQLTASVSSFDKRMIENLVEQITVLEEKNRETNELLAEQQTVKADLDKQYAELASQQAEAQELYDSATHDVEAAQSQYDAEQAAMRARAQSNSGSASAPTFSGSASFKWPSDYTYVSAGFQSNDSVHNGTHNGIDIAGSGIMGTPIYATGDGYVTYVANSCPHNFGKSYGCGCGGNYGRYAQIDHGYVDGNHYVAVYAHATEIYVSPGQYVHKGDVIGAVGTTGWSTGPHLHFGLLQNGGWINPLALAYN